ALAGGEVGHPAARHGKALADAGGGVLALRLEEHQLVAPQVRLPVHDGRVEPAAHGGRAGDRIRAGRLADAYLDVDDRLCSVAGGRDAGVLIAGLDSFSDRLRGAGGPRGHGNAHDSPFSTKVPGGTTLDVKPDRIPVTRAWHSGCIGSARGFAPAAGSI